MNRILAYRLARLTAKPDPAVEAVAAILESDSGGLNRKIVAQVVAAVRAADKEGRA